MVEKNPELRRVLCERRGERDSAVNEGRVVLGMRGNDPKTPNIVSRLTILMSDAILQTPFPGRFRSSVSSYDLLSVQPSSEKQFRSACSDLDVDIISLDISKPLSFKIRATQVNLAISRGICFEIRYSQAVERHEALGNIVAGAKSLLKACKGRNLIVSSGTGNPFHARPPQDVENL